MAQEALVRLKLDTSGATSAYDSFVGHVRRNPPAANLPGGGGGGGFTGGGSGVGGGGFDINSLLTKLVAAFSVQQAVGAIGPAALGMGRDALRESLLGGAFGSARGALASRDTVASRFGLAYQLGSVDDDMLKTMYGVEQQYGAGAAAKGAARARAALSGSVISDVGSELAEVAAGLVPILGDLAEAVRGLKEASGGGP
jgi:hypothetical protein